MTGHATGTLRSNGARQQQAEQATAAGTLPGHVPGTSQQQAAGSPAVTAAGLLLGSTAGSVAARAAGSAAGVPQPRLRQAGRDTGTAAVHVTATGSSGQLPQTGVTMVSTVLSSQLTCNCAMHFRVCGTLRCVLGLSILAHCMHGTCAGHTDEECLACRSRCVCVVSGFARPQPRAAAPAPAAQQQPARPWRASVQWDEIKKADALLAGVRARQAGLVQQQLQHLILTQPLATDNVWQKVCQVCVCIGMCMCQATCCCREGRAHTRHNMALHLCHALPRLSGLGGLCCHGCQGVVLLLLWALPPASLQLLGARHDETPGACCHACTAAAARRLVVHCTCV